MHAIGNTRTPSAEFNFYHDPEAAWIMLHSMKCKITCVPWETYLTHRIEWVKKNKKQ
jgi:inosine-uridine nucleoside N-ribohydrolase